MTYWMYRDGVANTYHGESTPVQRRHLTSGTCINAHWHHVVVIRSVVHCVWDVDNDWVLWNHFVSLVILAHIATYAVAFRKPKHCTFSF